MTTLIFDWSDWDGAASGWVSLTRVTWRRDPDTYQVPWTRQVRVEGRAVVPVEGMDGEVLRVRWSPDGGASRSEHVLVPAEGEHLVHLLERVDPSTLEPLPEDMPSAVDLVARAESLVTRIESGEFTGTDGDDGRGITSVEMVGASARFTWTDGTTQDVDLSALAGDDGDDGDDGVGVESVTLDGITLRFSLSDGTARDVDAAALRGKDGRTPALSWDGTRLVVDGVPGPSLKGEAGDDGHTPVPTWRGTALSWDGGEPVDLRGAPGGIVDSGWRVFPCVQKSDSPPASTMTMTCRARITSAAIHVEITVTALQQTGWQGWAVDDRWMQDNVFQPGAGGVVLRKDAFHLSPSLTWGLRPEAYPQKVIFTGNGTNGLPGAGTWILRGVFPPPAVMPSIWPGSAA